MSQDSLCADHAGFIPRLIAWMIDLVLILVFPLLLFANSGSLFDLIVLLIAFFYELILIGFYGQTLGKKILGLVVTDHSYQYPIGLGRSFARALWKAAVPLPLSALYILINEKSMAAHDKLADTYVVYKGTVQKAEPKSKGKTKTIQLPRKPGMEPLENMAGVPPLKIIVEDES